MIRDTSLGSRLFEAINVVILLVVLFVTLYPLYSMAIISISDGNAVLRGEVRLLPVGPTLETYKLVFKDPWLLRSLGNSLLYTSLGTLINLVMTVLCAYPLSRPKLLGKSFYTLIVMFTLFFTGGLIPLYLLVIQLGLKNTMWALLLPVAINPWYMFILRTSFQGIHEAIIESALIDGANDLQTLWRIVIPLSFPVLATLLLFYAVGQWNEWFNAIIFLDDRLKFPVQVVLRSIVLLGRMELRSEMWGASGMVIVEQSIKTATIMVSTLPILLVYPFVQRYFVKGVMIGAIKG